MVPNGQRRTLVESGRFRWVFRGSQMVSDTKRRPQMVPNGQRRALVGIQSAIIRSDPARSAGKVSQNSTKKPAGIHLPAGFLMQFEEAIARSKIFQNISKNPASISKREGPIGYESWISLCALVSSTMVLSGFIPLECPPGRHPSVSWKDILTVCFPMVISSWSLNTRRLILFSFR